jgi:hypothetical protein
MDSIREKNNGEYKEDRTETQKYKSHNRIKRLDIQPEGNIQRRLRILTAITYLSLTRGSLLFYSYFSEFINISS